jgi:hypothetical protein
MSNLAWLPILFVALLVVPAVLGLDALGGVNFTRFKSFRDRMRKEKRR